MFPIVLYIFAKHALERTKVRKMGPKKCRTSAVTLSNKWPSLSLTNDRHSRDLETGYNNSGVGEAFIKNRSVQRKTDRTSTNICSLVAA